MPLPEIADYPARFRYRFCPLCATPLQPQLDDGRVRLTCPVDGWKLYPMPNLGATVVVEHGNGIILLRRGIPPDIGMWHLPIGHLEFGEAPALGALRETSEETGLELTDLVFLDYEHSLAYGDPLMYYIIFCYRARSLGGEPRLNHENEAVRVCPVDELPEMKWSSQRRALAAWRAWREGRPWLIGQPLEDNPSASVDSELAAIQQRASP